MTLFDLDTPRLRLVAIHAAMMDADAARSEQLSELLAAEIPDAWPPEHWEPHVFAFMKEQAQQRPDTAGWHRYIVLKEPVPTLIGTLGAFPRPESEAEIGYSVLPAWQRRGLATEAVLALLGELRGEPTVRDITAQTFPDLVPSLGVLRRCGFRFSGPGSEDGAVLYRLERS